MSRIPAPPDEIETARLLLRRVREADADEIFRAYAADPEVTRYLHWRPHDHAASVRDFFSLLERRWDAGDEFTYAIEAGGSPPFGSIAIRPRPYRAEFGYVLARPRWGHGYMSEALSCLVDWSLSQETIWRASAFCDVDNIGSARVMEKAGMQFEGIMRRCLIHPNISDEPRDCRLYAKVR